MRSPFVDTASKFPLAANLKARVIAMESVIIVSVMVLLLECPYCCQWPQTSNGSTDNYVGSDRYLFRATFEVRL